MKIFLNAILFSFILIGSIYSNNASPSLQGEINDGNDQIPYATIQIKSTTIGTATDASGKFTFSNIPIGEQVLIIKALGYKTKEIKINISAEESQTINITLDEDVLGLEQVVVTADKSPKRRIDASMIVNTMTPKQLDRIQAISISDGLNFTSGLRMENNCQNCGANALRMNGLDGSYSQILINGRPIFSGLASVYGLEIIPANMIQQLEVVKGGGSALYGSNAVAGTINLILKEPLNNHYEASVNNGIIGLGEDPENDLNLNFNTTVVSDDKNSGLALYATHRKRNGFDANGDGFTELAELNNTTFGANVYHKIGYRNKITLDYFNINEDRRGGNMLDVIEHEADIAESVRHKINTAAINFTRFVGENSGELSVYGSFQYVDRWTYYGAKNYEEGSDVGIPDMTSYGTTTDMTYNYGVQFKNGNGRYSYILGVEDLGDILNDKKSGYTEDGVYNEPTVVSDQVMNTIGAFGQFDYTLSKLTASLGLRVDKYDIDDRSEENTGDNNNTVVSPRVNLLYKAMKGLQVRGSFSTGYRAPQIFDEDLHIETSQSRKVIHANSADLKQESSKSYMCSLDYQTEFGQRDNDLEILVEGFYTEITDAFANEYSDMDANGVVTYTRINGGGAAVSGVNIEARIYPAAKWNLDLGFTVQTSSYDQIQDNGIKEFVRTPNQYGYFTFNVDPFRNFTLSLNGNYTGSMKLEYYGNSEDGEIRDSKEFFDIGIKGEYKIKNNKGFDISLNAGLKNIFNSYQDDLDTGRDRDPGYIYGPSIPRSVYLGVKIGNIL